jgi:hypothetical protein
MSCESAINKIARVAVPLSAGISSLAGKRAFFIGLASAGSLGASLAMLALRRHKRKQRDRFSEKNYIKRGFDLAAGQTLTGEFGGAQVSLDSLKEAAGPGSVIRPVLKQGGEDDIFLLEGPNGDIYYSLPEETTARIQAIVPKKGQGARLKQALDASGPKYVIADRVTGQEYVTRDPEEARYFGAALGADGDTFVLAPGDETWEMARRPIPAALFY